MLVHAYLVSGTVPADEREAVPAGADGRYGCDHAHHDEGHRRFQSTEGTVREGQDQLDGCAEVKYVYVTKHHILEEKSAYRVSAKRGDAKHTMPDEIARQFRIISKKMLASGTDIWIDSNEDLQIVNTQKAV